MLLMLNAPASRGRVCWCDWWEDTRLAQHWRWAPDATWHPRVRNAMLLATSGDLLAACFPAQVKPTGAQVDRVMAAGPRNSMPASIAWQRALTTAAHLSAHDGGIDRDVLATQLAAVPGDTGRYLAAEFNDDGPAQSAAAVGALPAGLLPLRGHNPALTARRAAAVSISDPLASDGAAALATAIMLAAQGFPVADSTIGRFLSLVSSAGHNPQLPALMPVVRVLAQHHPLPAQASATLRIGPTVLRTLPAALTAYLLHPGDPKGALRYALMMAGSNRTVAVMTGALAGASCPDFSPPVHWLPSATLRHRVRACAAGIAELAFRDSTQSSGLAARN